MSGSGSGTGTPIPSGPVSPVGTRSRFDEGFSLARYAQIIGYGECAFFGVANGLDPDYACRAIWSEYERSTISEALSEAQEELEAVIGYPIFPRWIANEQHPFRNPILTKYAKVLSVGVMATQDLATDVIVNYTTEPATVTVAPVTFTDVSEALLYYPGTKIQVIPSYVTLNSGTLVFYIPRARLVALDKWDNPPAGWDYNDVTNFQPSLDVVRVYNDPSKQAELVLLSACLNGDACTESIVTACEYIADSDIGKFYLQRANYVAVSRVWDRNCACYGHADFVRLNYRAGLATITRQMESALIRLAHSKMPTEPCGCDVTQRLWARDRNIPQLLTRERLECPFGISDGAWMAYRFALTMQVPRASVL